MPLRMIASFRNPRGFGRVKENLSPTGSDTGARAQRRQCLVQELFRKQAPLSSEVSG